MAAEAVRDTLFIQFAREPVPGRVKTRMLPVLDPEAACRLHCELVQWTSRVLTSAGLGRVELHVAGDLRAPLFGQCRQMGVAALQQQRGGDLGERMYNALEKGLERHARVVLVGSDCPQIDRRYLRDALSALDAAPVSLGPAQDGGYVLIAVREVHARWFEGISWGGDRVFADTLSRLQETATSWRELPLRQDIDRPQDLALWRQIVGAGQ
ncbi:glycosyltransferase [Pseudohalioglobus sediminis]|uniref:Glycosyltransferase n=1 Tax=Pseudohalioglobus sediminis TaxID=2606449 RepID=A0A5B0X5T2_9GAMM|nr:TIGR04282 family arsenosugar biosynthesis glycosyltransferase [Pseudohalioglobus sediminis]KAA1193928.1 glycosyltransferase [Pseudohalioglobus sediminis]